jgi:hypothetical protein
MYKEHPSFLKPQGNKVKTRRYYMDFTKFVSLLEQSELFFARADKLGDIFEGAYRRKMSNREQSNTKKFSSSFPGLFAGT